MDLRESDGAVWAVGLMSGTSMDGIDAALLRTDGHQVFEVGPALTVAYDEATRARIRALLGTPPGRSVAEVADLARDLTERHAEVAARLIGQSGVTPAVVGFHGQTLLHRPEARLSVQIGDGALLARRLGVAVVNDLRQADVRAGGQGAPLVPAYHLALAKGLARPLAVLNLGGVGNVTWIGEGDQPPVAFDTGPGNALIDDWMRRRRGVAMDADGALARSGRIDGAALEALLGHDYFRKPAPKSLDRDAFSLEPVNGLSDGDGAATLVAFTAASVARARDWMPAPPKRWLVCGGGRRNGAIMEALTRGLGVAVDPVEAVGWDGDALEAQAFAFLAVRGARGLPLTWPTTTGAPRPLTGGTYWPAATVLGASAVAR